MISSRFSDPLEVYKEKGWSRSGHRDLYLNRFSCVFLLRVCEPPEYPLHLSLRCHFFFLPSSAMIEYSHAVCLGYRWTAPGVRTGWPNLGRLEILIVEAPRHGSRMLRKLHVDPRICFAGYNFPRCTDACR